MTACRCLWRGDPWPPQGLGRRRWAKSTQTSATGCGSCCSATGRAGSVGCLSLTMSFMGPARGTPSGLCAPRRRLARCHMSPTSPWSTGGCTSWRRRPRARRGRPGARRRRLRPISQQPARCPFRSASSSPLNAPPSRASRSSPSSSPAHPRSGDVPWRAAPRCGLRRSGRRVLYAPIFCRQPRLQPPA